MIPTIKDYTKGGQRPPQPPRLRPEELKEIFYDPDQKDRRQGLTGLRQKGLRKPKSLEGGERGQSPQAKLRTAMRNQHLIGPTKIKKIKYNLDPNTLKAERDKLLTSTATKKETEI